MTQFNADIDIERLEAQTYAYRLDLIDNDNDVKLQLRQRLQHQLQESRPRVKILKHNFLENNKQSISRPETLSVQTDRDLSQLFVRQMQLSDSSGYDDTCSQNLTEHNDINLQFSNATCQSAPSMSSSEEQGRQLVLRKSARTRKKVRRYEDCVLEGNCRNAIIPNDYCVSTTGVDGTLTLNIRISPRPHRQKYVKQLSVDVGQELNSSERNLANVVRKLALTETVEHDKLQDDEILSQLILDLIEPNDVETWHAANALDKINNNVSDNYNTSVSVQSEQKSSSEKIIPKRRHNPSISKGSPLKKRSRKAKNANEASTNVKSDLAKYVEMFANDCEMSIDSSAVTLSSNASQQLVTSTTQPLDDSMTQTPIPSHYVNWTDSGNCQLVCNDNLIIDDDTVQMTENDCNMALQFDDFVNYIDSSNIDVGNNVIARVLEGGNNAQLPVAGWHNGQYTTHQISGQPLECQSIIRLPDNTIVANIQMPTPLITATPLEPPPLDAPPQAHNCCTVLDLSIKSNHSADILNQSPGETEDIAIDDTPIDLTVKKTTKPSAVSAGDDESGDNFILRLIETTGYDLKTEEENNTSTSLVQTPEVALDMPLLEADGEIKIPMLDPIDKEAAPNDGYLSDSNNNNTSSSLMIQSTPNNSLCEPRKDSTDSIGAQPVEMVLRMIFSETNDQDALSSSGSEIATMSHVSNCKMQEALTSCGIDLAYVNKSQNSDENQPVEIKEEETDVDLELHLTSFTVTRPSSSIESIQKESVTDQPEIFLKKVEKQIIKNTPKNEDKIKEKMAGVKGKRTKPMVQILSDVFLIRTKDADSDYIQNTLHKAPPPAKMENSPNCKFDESPNTANNENQIEELHKSVEDDVCDNVESHNEMVFADATVSDESNTEDSHKTAQNPVCERMSSFGDIIFEDVPVIEESNKIVENDVFENVETMEEINLEDPLVDEQPKDDDHNNSTGKEENIESIESEAGTDVAAKEDEYLDLEQQMPKLKLLENNSQELIDDMIDGQSFDENELEKVECELKTEDELTDEDKSNHEESGISNETDNSNATEGIKVQADANLTKETRNDVLECTLDDMDLELDYEYDDAISLATSYFDSGDENDVGDSEGTAQGSSEHNNEYKNTIVSADSSPKADIKTNLRPTKKFIIPKLKASNNNKNDSTATETPTAKQTPIVSSQASKFVGLDKIKRTVENICAVPPPSLLQPTALISANGAPAAVVPPPRIMFHIPPPSLSANTIGGHFMDEFAAVTHLPAYRSLNRGEISGTGGVGLNRGPTPLDCAKFFGITCMAFLSEKCFAFSSCKLSHHLREPGQVKTSIETLSKPEINVVYKFIYKHTKLYRRYCNVFCQVYTSQKNRTKLLNMVYDCERHIDCAHFVRTIYHCLVQCGLSKVNACRQVLSRSHFQSAAICDVLLNIIMEADWMMFTDYIERIADTPLYKFRFDVMSKMAPTVLRSKNSYLEFIFFKCMTKLFKDDLDLMPKSPEIMQLLLQQKSCQ